MKNKVTRQNSIDDLKSKIYYAENSHAALYESNAIYIKILREELSYLECQENVSSNFFQPVRLAVF